MTKPLRIVVVCTGNRFRSPLAAAVLTRALDPQVPAEVSSAGTLDVDGQGALPEALPLARLHGIDLDGHRARQIRRGDLADADVVLGFEKFHLAAAVVDGGAPRSAVYTLPELVELLERTADVAGATPHERARARLASAAAARGAIGRPREIPDPYGRPAARQRETADEVVGLSERLAALLSA